MSFGAPRRVCLDGNEGMFRPRLHPPWPAVRINNNLLLWLAVHDASRDRIDSFSSTLRRRRNMGELDRGRGIGFLRVATTQRNAENHQQRSLQETWNQQSLLHGSEQCQNRVDYGLLDRSARADFEFYSMCGCQFYLRSVHLLPRKSLNRATVLQSSSFN